MCHNAPVRNSPAVDPHPHSTLIRAESATNSTGDAASLVFHVHSELLKTATPTNLRTAILATEVARSVHRLLRVEATALLLHDGEPNCLVTSAVEGVVQDCRPQWTYRPGESIAGDAYATNSTLLSNAVSSDTRVSADFLKSWSRCLPSGAVRNIACFPFRGPLETGGVLCIVNRQDADGSGSAFLESDLRSIEFLLPTVVGWLSLAAVARQGRALGELIAEHSFADQPLAFGQTVCRLATTLTNAAAANLYVVDDDPNHLRLLGSYGFAKSYPSLDNLSIQASISGHVAQSGQAQWVADLHQAKGVANRAVAVSEGFRSALVVPLGHDHARGDNVLGCIAVFSKEPRTFHPGTEAALTLFGRCVGTIVSERQKTVTVDRLTGAMTNAGHSIRHPLGRINNAVTEIRAILREPHSTEDVSAILDAIVNETKRMRARSLAFLHARKGLLAVSGLTRTMVHVGELIVECAKRFATETDINKTPIVVYDSVKRLPTVSGDYELLDLLFENILENAVKYSWKNEPIEVRGEHTERAIRVSIADRGQGIPEKFYNKIFDVAQRSPIVDPLRHIKGTGLGLQIVREITLQHGGSVKVLSVPFVRDAVKRENYEGYETTFTVSLPRGAHGGGT
jgi:signal transduction histidine kinase